MSPSMYDPYHPVKPYFPQQILCCDVYQFPEAATGRVLSKKILKNWKISLENTCVGVNKAAGLWVCNFIKIDSNAGAFYVIFENFKSTYFEEQLLLSASEK